MATFKLNFLPFCLSISMALMLSACGGSSSGDSSNVSDDSTEDIGLTAKESAIDKIKAYSNGESSSTPTLNDYIAAGVTGVTSETLAELNAIVKGLSPEDVDSTAKLKALTTQLGINIIPIANSGGNQTVQVNKSIQLTGSGIDVDGTVVSYSWEMDDVVLATKASFIYTPTVIGTESLTLNVTDNDGDVASDTMSLVVTAVPTASNQAPTANAGEDKIAQVGIGISVSGSGSDNDGTIAAYEWSIGGTILANSSAIIYTPTEVGTDTLKLTVIDNAGESASDTVNVVVSEAPDIPNEAPVANAGGDKVAQVNKSIQIIGSGTDSDGTIATYEWSKGFTVIASTAVFNYIPTATGTDTLTLTVTDNNGDSASDTMDVVVNATPPTDVTPPVINLLGSSSVNVDQNATYTDAGATASDNADGVITNNIVVAGDTVNTNATPGSSFTITYNVSDAAGNAATQVTRTVNIVSAADTIDPVITLSGSTTVEVIQGANYVEAGATASDNRDGNLTSNIVIAGDVVNTSAEPGTTFTLTYNVSDAAGNPAIEVTRSVSIIASPPSNVIPILSASSIQTYLSTINNARAVNRSCGANGNFPAVAAVSWSDKLYKAAYEHSQDMSESNTFDHNGSGTVSDWTGYPSMSSMTGRVATYGYSWSSLSENIVAGTVINTAQEAVDAWLASDGHCANIMSSSVTQVGMALSSNLSSTYTHYWTQNFGRP